MLLWQRAQRRNCARFIMQIHVRNARNKYYKYLGAFRSTDLSAQGRRVVGLEFEMFAF